jgi:hypothetical protein
VGAPAGGPGELFEKAKRNYRSLMREAYATSGKHARADAVDGVKKAAVENLCHPDDATFAADVKLVKKALADLEYEVVRQMCLDGKRVDGRALDQVRPIAIETGVLPRTHGSALFTRGETQAIVTVTLGTTRDQQIVDGLMGEYGKRFDLQYNFPPFSTGEVKPIRGTARREIGHGNLAERAVKGVFPAEASFPYTTRVVSEITESERLLLDGLRLRRDPRAHGRGLPDHAAGRRHRDGSHQGRRRHRDPFRHPRNGRPPRRHGLQGRRLGPRHHRGADGHQDHGHHPRHHEPCVGTGPSRPFPHPR